MAGTIGRQLSCAIPLAVWRRMVPRDVIAVCYHMVSDRSLPHVRHLYPYKSAAAFRQDLLFLRDNYRIISYQELHDHRLAGKPLEGPSVHISFDDGFAECDTVVRPLLVELDLPCSFFINTDFVDNGALFYRNQASLCIDRLRSLAPDESGQLLGKVAERCGGRPDDLQDVIQWVAAMGYADRPILDDLSSLLGVNSRAFLAAERPYLTGEQIRSLATDGFTIGGHTRSHERLSSATTPAEVRQQIVASCSDIRDLTGQAVVPFAFPFSGAGIDRRLLAQVMADHPFIGLMFDTQKLKKDSSFVVNRICCDTPPADSAQGSNLPTALCNAYFSLTASLLGN
jgi:peptidoglycan/xylan/chitin deacetylase (PgdA/CDA1 family)